MGNENDRKMRGKKGRGISERDGEIETEREKEKGGGG